MASDNKNKPQSDNWVVRRSKSYPDRIFYYNTVTKESKWENPQKMSACTEGTSEDNTNIKQRKKKKRKKKVSDFLEDVKKEKERTSELDRNQFKSEKELIALRNEMQKSKKHERNSASLIKVSSGRSKDLNYISKRKFSEASQLHYNNLNNEQLPVICAFTGAQKNQSSKVLELNKDYKSENYVSQPSFQTEKTEAIETVLKIEAETKTQEMKLVDDKKNNSKIGFEKSSTSNKDKVIPKVYCSSSHGIVSKNRVKNLIEERIKKDKNFQQRVLSMASGNPAKLDVGSVQKHDTNNIPVNKSIIAEDEAMDWEPLEEEKVIEHINFMRKNFCEQQELCSIIAPFSTEDTKIESSSSNLICVFDTNVFISSLSFIVEVRDKFIEGYGLPHIFIPWRVLQELDHLKSSSNNNLRIQATRAISYLNENFRSKHPRISGQSLDDFLAMFNEQSTLPDDQILQVCLLLKKATDCKKVILITNDKNLESKALLSGIESFSKNRFQEAMLLNSSAHSSRNSRPENIVSNHENDDLYCKLKTILSAFFKLMIEVELKVAYTEDWEKMIHRKPPWTLRDLIETVIDHWRSVFTFVLQKDILNCIKELKVYVVQANRGNLTQILDTIRISQKILSLMKTPELSGKPYVKMLDQTIEKIELLLTCSQNLNEEKCTKSMECVDIPAFQPEIREVHGEHVVQLPAVNVELCREKIKCLLSIVWEHVKNFCSRLLDLAARDGMRNPAELEEIKSQFPHLVRIVEELNGIIERVLSLPGEGISEESEIILYFSNFLVQLNIFQLDVSELKNFLVYMSLFCRDNEGRVILGNFISDLKKFAVDITNGMTLLGLL